RHHGEARLPRRVAEQLLKKKRIEQVEPEHHQHHVQDDDDRDVEERNLEDIQIENRLGKMQFAVDQQNYREHGDAGEDTDPPGGEPVGTLAAIEYDLQQAQPQREVDDARII